VPIIVAVAERTETTPDSTDKADEEQRAQDPYQPRGAAARARRASRRQPSALRVARSAARRWWRKSCWWLRTW